MIKEVIVVEGRDDIRAVKRALDCELIATGGFGFPKGVMERIKSAQARRGVIIFTDPDYAGERIRKKISDQVESCKHAFLPREDASPESILAALAKVRTEIKTENKEFSNVDLVKNGLIGGDQSSHKRDKIGRILGIGYGNSKQFLSRLNNYGVTRKEFDQALKEYAEGSGDHE